jgi:hypothetical protein
MSITSRKIVQPHQLGWLRRPELDRDGLQVWEQPDGGLYVHGGQVPLVFEVVRNANRA